MGRFGGFVRPGPAEFAAPIMARPDRADLRTMPARKKPARKRVRTVRLLFTCIGRRVELVRAFERAAGELGLRLEVHGADATRLSPAMQLIEHAHVVPTIASGRYIDALSDIIRRYRIDLLIPLLDLELAAIADARSRFAELGCHAIVSSPAVIEICQDKLATHRTLQAAGIDTPQTWPWVVALEQKRHRFPYYMKPRRGSAAKGNYVIHDADELRVLGRRVDDAIVQEFIRGEEYTLDVYTGFDGVPRCAVPRKRLEVRTGEVSKGIVVRHPEVMAMGRRVAEVLGECRGVITVQCMMSPEGRIRVIEMNPRFGGGAPLAIHAGADFPRWILQEHTGRKPRISAMGFRDGVAMLRYDQSVFVRGADKRPAKRAAAAKQPVP
jgi:carbamoyl-phosphate synthase large subunit